VGTQQERAAVGPGRQSADGRNATVSELGQLAVGGRDPLLLGAEVDEDGNLFLDTDDHTEPVTVMSYLIMKVIVLDVPDRCRVVVEGTSGERTPGRGASCLHGIPV
jgi:hypothetical protein